MTILDVTHDGIILNCVFCLPNKPQKVLRSGSGWLIGNFVKHCEKFHYALPEAGPKRKRKRRHEVNATSDARYSGDKSTSDPDLPLFDVDEFIEANDTNANMSGEV